MRSLNEIKEILARDIPAQEKGQLIGIAERTVRRWVQCGIPSHVLYADAEAKEQSVFDGVDPDALQHELKHGPTSIIDLANRFDVSPSKIETTIKQLRESNILIELKDEHVLVGSPVPSKAGYSAIDFSRYKETEYPLGCVSDTHLCSKYERLDVLNSVYDRFEAAGIETTLHAGNLIDGESRLNMHEIHTHGVEGQTDYLVKNYPVRNGITTKFITGECHEGWWVKSSNLNIGQHIEDAARRAGREDLIFLGHMEYDIWFKQPHGKSRLRVVHPGGGSSYAESYSAQKYLEALQEGEKPDIIVGGHTHKHNMADARGVPYWQVGCVQDQTPFMRGRKLKAKVGAGILWLKQNELGIFTSIKYEWWPYYDKKFYAYFWKQAG